MSVFCQDDGSEEGSGDVECAGVRLRESLQDQETLDPATCRRAHGREA